MKRAAILGVGLALAAGVGAWFVLREDDDDEALCFTNEAGFRECYGRPLKRTPDGTKADPIVCERLKYVAKQPNTPPELRDAIAQAMLEDWGDDDC